MRASDLQLFDVSECGWDVEGVVDLSIMTCDTACPWARRLGFGREDFGAVIGYEDSMFELGR